MRRGATLIDLALTLSLMSLLSAIALPRVGRAVDALRVRAASDELVTAVALARESAVARGSLSALALDPTRGAFRVTVDGDTLVRRDLADAWGVRLSATRDTIRFAPTGLGYGAANTTVVVSRGASADTIVVSRLGRVRR